MARIDLQWTFYHRGPSGLTVLKPGGVQPGFTLAGGLEFKKYYSIWPLFLSKRQDAYSLEPGKAVYQIEGSTLDQDAMVADLPSLVDAGMQIDESEAGDIGFWEGNEPEILAPYLEEGQILLTDLVPLWREAAMVTGSIGYTKEITNFRRIESRRETVDKEVLTPEQIQKGDKVLVTFAQGDTANGTVCTVRRHRDQELHLLPVTAKDGYTPTLQLVYSTDPAAGQYYGHYGWFDKLKGNDSRKEKALAWIYKVGTKETRVENLIDQIIQDDLIVTRETMSLALKVR